MELNELFLWLVGMSCVATMVRVVTIPATRFWLLNVVVVFGVSVLAWRFWPAVAGFVAFVAWALLLLVPGLVNRKVAGQSLRQDYAAAARTVGWMRYLVPAPYIWRMPALLRAVDAGEHGRLTVATDQLARLSLCGGQTGALATVHLYRLRRDWEGLVQWVEERFPVRRLRSHPALLAGYLRGLGETHRPSEMVEVFGEVWPSMQGAAFVAARRPCLLAVFAFAGRSQRVAEILNASAGMSPDVRRIWLATAAYAAGDSEAAHVLLGAVSGDATAMTRLLVQDRLTRPNPVAGPLLSERAREILGRVEQDVHHERAFGLATVAAGVPWVTYALIFLNVAMFVVEALAGGTTNDEAIYRLGALNLYAVEFAHQYWRILAANFLHYGAGHILANMLGLYVLGRWLESRLGWVRYLLVYLASGVGALVVVLLIAHWRHRDLDLLVGASGCVMGLVGSTGAVLLHGWVRGRSREAARRFRSIVFIVALQVVFDLLIPQVSFTAHASGTVIGFLLTLLLVGRRTTVAAAPVRAVPVDVARV